MEGKFSFEFRVNGRLTTSFIQDFRNTFPEFSDPVAYPDAKIQFFYELAKVLMDKDTWMDLYPYGLYLFIAHNLLVEKMRLAMFPNGLYGGVGPVSAQMRSVDGVSYSNKYMMGFYRNAGFWALSAYGQQYYDMIMLVGMRPTQLWNKERTIGRHRYG